ncbi:MAG: serine/threonine-protein kinase [Cyanobacteria bacterium J06621_11]
MPQAPKRSFARKNKSTDATATLTTKDKFSTWQQQLTAKYWRFAISAVTATVAASAVGLNLGIVNLLERQVQSLFFELRGPVEAPKNIVILAIDEDSLDQGQHYRDDPDRYEDMEPIATWPWKRQAYAQVIERLMEAGAKAVALDILFLQESGHGFEDDEAFAEVLTRYSDRIVLAMEYRGTSEAQGEFYQAILPLEQFQAAGVQLGTINFPLEPNQQIHRLGQTFLADIKRYEQEALYGQQNGQQDGQQSNYGNGQSSNREASAVIQDQDPAFDFLPLSFPQAVLNAARVPYTTSLQENIFFHGPGATFEQIPFWHVLDDDPWRNQLNSGQGFKDKIVIIGATAAAEQDFHKVPFAQSLLYPYKMPGVEILANAVATLEQGISPTRLIRSPHLNAIAVLALGLSIAALINKTQRHSRRAMIALGGLSFWMLIGYVAFVYGNVVVITGTPAIAIATIGLLDFGISVTSERFKKRRLRTSLARYATSPLVQEIISQQDDFHDLLDLNRADIIGKLLRDRYRILEVIGAGGFGETYKAQDTQRPGNPVCVVKQLKIVSDNPKSHHLASRLFKDEAIVLGQLGEHSQIPRLLAYFEVQQTFYLVQEMIAGKLLRDILSRSRPLSQRAVLQMLLDLIPVISFVHSQGVIHRDIKPSNIILRNKDKRYVLIDFGAVKTISNQLPESATRMPSTVGIGTQGYMPSEQSIGRPTVRSDIYALGITAIEALTGRPPHALKRSDDGEIIWSHTIEDISPDLSRIINKMVRYDFNKRYGSSNEVLIELQTIKKEQLTDRPTIASEEFQMMDGTTVNQGTRPGVIDTDSELGSTQILPENWLNDMETKAENTDSSTE